MASTLTAGTMTVSISESITLNGKNQGGITSKTILTVANVLKRQIRCPLDEITLYTTHASAVAGSQFDSDLIKYARISNLDDANSVDIIITSATNDEVCRTLKAGESFLLWGHDSTIFADGSALTVADAVAATASLSIADGDDATSGQFTEGEYVKFIATDGTVGIFILSDSSETGAVASGTVLDAASDLGTTNPSSSLLSAGTCVAVTMNLNTCSQALLLNELRDTMGASTSPLLNKVSGAAGTVPSSNGNQDFTGGVDGAVDDLQNISSISAIAKLSNVDVEVFVAGV